MAVVAMEAVDLADQEISIEEMRRNAMSGLYGFPMSQPKFITVGTVITVVGTAITLTRAYRKMRNLSHKHQNAPVRRVATSSEQGRQEIRSALAAKGVYTPDSISGEELAELFERQTDRHVRAAVSGAARDFNLVNSADASSPAHEVAVEAMEDRI